MATATAISGGIGSIAGGAKFFERRRMQKKAQSAIDAFQYQKLDNAYDDVTVSTLGSDLQREEMARSNAMHTQALQKAGTRGLIGGLGRLQSRTNQMSQQIGANLDQQQKQIDFARAQDETRIQGMTERRQAEELAGLGQQLSTGMNTKYQSVGDVINGINVMGQAGQQSKQELMSLFGMSGGTGEGVFTKAMGGQTVGNNSSSFDTSNMFNNTSQYLNR